MIQVNFKAFSMISHLNGIKVSTSTWSQLMKNFSNFEENLFFLM